MKSQKNGAFRLDYINRAKRPLLYQEVVNDLYDIIDTQQICPGQRLPTERELCEKLGVSRNVLREAFHVLEQRGIIVSRQGSGRSLRSIPTLDYDGDKDRKMSKYLERYSLCEAYEVRQVLEVKAMELIVNNATELDFKEIEETYVEMVANFSKTNSTAGEFELHKAYARKTKNTFMEHTLYIVFSTILDMMSTTSSDILILHEAELEAKQHRKIIDALKNRDKTLAGQYMYEHIQNTIDYLRS